MRRRSCASAVALARGVQVDATEADEARSRPRRCDMISATISGGTSAKNSGAPEPHDALHLDVFRLESRLPATSESTMKATKNTRLCVRVQLFEKWMYSQA